MEGHRQAPRRLNWLLPGRDRWCGAVGQRPCTAWRSRRVAFTVGSPQLHHPWSSSIAAGRSLALELVGLGSNPLHKWSAVPVVLSRLLIAAGVGLLWASSRARHQHQDDGTRRQIIVIGAAFLIASLASLFGAYVHFGSAAGERYETLRRCWILMTYAAIAALIVQSGPNSRISQRKASPVGPVLLIAGVLTALACVAAAAPVRNVQGHGVHDRPGTSSRGIEPDTARDDLRFASHARRHHSGLSSSPGCTREPRKAAGFSNLCALHAGILREAKPGQWFPTVRCKAGATGRPVP